MVKNKAIYTNIHLVSPDDRNNAIFMYMNMGENTFLGKE